MTHGFYMALAGAFLVMALYILGFHSDPEKFGIGQAIATVGGLAISIIFMLSGVREKRALTPADQKWGYGSAMGTAFMVGLFGTLIGLVFNYLYFFHINSSFSELVLQTELAKLEAQDVPPEAIEKAEPFIEMMTSAPAMLATGAIFGLIGNTVIALIMAAFTKNRPETTPLPVVRPFKTRSPNPDAPQLPIKKSTG